MLIIVIYVPMENTQIINYIHFDVIDSTNSWAKKNAAILERDGFTCITAAEQTKGRGSYGKKWISPKGLGIHATLFFCLSNDFTPLSSLTQVLSISCALVLKDKGFDARIKWPNDVFISGKKVAGILCESIDLGEVLGIALGIGINVNMTQEILKTIDQPATSLSQLSTHTWKLEQILDPLLFQFINDLETLKDKGFLPFQETYDQLLL